MISVIVFDPGISAIFWIGFALFGTFTALSYPALSRNFPISQAGRVNASLNFTLFVGGFLLQWSFGLVVDRLEPSMGTEGAFEAAIGSLIALQLIAFGWYFVRKP
jgi:hypothetical protein